MESGQFVVSDVFSSVRDKSLLKFIANFAKKLFAALDVLFALNTLRAIAINNAQYPSSLFGFCHNNLQGISRGAKDRTYFRTSLDGIQNIHRKCLLDEDDKGMTGCNVAGILDRNFFQRAVIPFCPDKTWTRCLTEGNAELNSRHSIDHNLIQVFRRFDKMGLPNDDIGPPGDIHCNGFNFHNNLIQFNDVDLSESIKGFIELFLVADHENLDLVRMQVFLRNPLNIFLGNGLHIIQIRFEIV